MPTQEMREQMVKLKLNPIRDALEGKRIAVVDDSIVRGTTSRKLVKLLREYGAKEVHMVSTSNGASFANSLPIRRRALFTLIPSILLSGRAI